MLSNNHSMVIRNSNSSSNLAANRQIASSKNATPNGAQQNNSKSVLSSFRNGPVKILNGA